MTDLYPRSDQNSDLINFVWNIEILIETVKNKWLAFTHGVTKIETVETNDKESV